jgi:hypothetical protein
LISLRSFDRISAPTVERRVINMSHIPVSQPDLGEAELSLTAMEIDRICSAIDARK